MPKMADFGNFFFWMGKVGAERTVPIFASSSRFFLFFPISPSFSRFLAFCFAVGVVLCPPWTPQWHATGGRASDWCRIFSRFTYLGMEESQHHSGVEGHKVVCPIHTFRTRNVMITIISRKTNTHFMLEIVRVFAANHVTVATVQNTVRPLDDNFSAGS